MLIVVIQPRFLHRQTVVADRPVSAIHALTGTSAGFSIALQDMLARCAASGRSGMKQS
jgi:hypothetical protein